MGPAVVLVHGAFADASGFAGVIRELESAGHTVLAPPNPLRGVAFDASVVSDVVKTIDGSHTAFMAKPVAVATFIRQAPQ
jgi:hypothetical protein